MDKDGVEYVFDGRGNLSGGGTLTVTADGVTSYGYKITSNGVDVYDGDVKMGEIKEAVDCYDEFIALAPNDPNRFIFKYKILKNKLFQ